MCRGVIGKGIEASLGQSYVMRAFLSALLGPFIAFQVCLDLSYFWGSALFSRSASLDCGPGAVSDIASIFPGLADEVGGMCRRRRVQEKCVPFFLWMAEDVRYSDLPGAVFLRQGTDILLVDSQ